MLDPAEVAGVAEVFGVAAEQVRRDHLLSHLLAALSRVPGCTERVVFMGGTALARTHLPDGRLSEDLDLLALSARRELATDIETALLRGVLREYGRLHVDPPLHRVRSSDPAVLSTVDGLRVRVQLLSARHYPHWPTEVRALHQRYADARPARLRVPTLPAFAAAKTVAWADRRAPRDLFDLAGLARIGAINTEALRLYVAHGPTGQPPAGWLFDPPPEETGWQAELAAQTRLTLTADQAALQVRTAWHKAVRNPGR